MTEGTECSSLDDLVTTILADREPGEKFDSLSWMRLWPGGGRRKTADARSLVSMLGRSEKTSTHLLCTLRETGTQTDTGDGT